MDGFDARGEVKLIAATNHLDMLDPALLRPGRLDRVIEIPMPSRLEAGEAILKIHTSGMRLDEDVNLRMIAGLAEGSSGADLKALSTEAGMYAIREARTTVYQSDFESATTRYCTRRGASSASLRTGAAVHLILAPKPIFLLSRRQASFVAQFLPNLLEPKRFFPLSSDEA